MKSDTCIFVANWKISLKPRFAKTPLANSEEKWRLTLKTKIYHGCIIKKIQGTPKYRHFSSMSTLPFHSVLLFMPKSPCAHDPLLQLTSTSLFTPNPSTNQLLSSSLFQFFATLQFLYPLYPSTTIFCSPIYLFDIPSNPTSILHLSFYHNLLNPPVSTTSPTHHQTWLNHWLPTHPDQSWGKSTLSQAVP